VTRVHLTGWTQIGIVASVVWFFVFGGYFIVTWSGELMHSYQRQLDMCYRTLNFELQSDDPKERKSASEYKTCIENTRLGEIDSKNLRDLLLVNIGTIILGWIAVMSATLIVRWIRKGLA
jgi:hypothetical protein